MTVTKPKDPIYIPHAGPALLATPLLNKGTAFSEQERHDFNLTGLIPNRFETIEEQAERAYLQYKTFKTPINQHIYLRYLQDNNETLFYYLLKAHLVEMMPIIYTPTVGEACERFSEIYRRARGVFISYPDKDRIDEILHNVTKDKIKVIVVTDGSRILGLGDQGVGGMGIPIGKLSLYTACAGISPAYTLPIMLDIGTNNQTLLNNLLYIGWKHKRINDIEYDEFIELFIKAVKKRWPDVLLQFEDFEQSKALPILERYQHQLCCFNDDIQGTAAVTVGTLLAACQVKNQTLSQQKIVFAGAGSAGCGIAEQIICQMMAAGLDETQARERGFLIRKDGVLGGGMGGGWGRGWGWVRAGKTVGGRGRAERARARGELGVGRWAEGRRRTGGAKPVEVSEGRMSAWGASTSHWTSSWAATQRSIWPTNRRLRPTPYSALPGLNSKPRRSLARPPRMKRMSLMASV